MADYTATADVRLQNALFTVGNISDAVVTSFIANAQRDINSALGIETDLTAAQITASNVKTVANYHCAIDCCSYNPTLFQNVSFYAMQLDAYYAAYKSALKLLVSYLGSARAPDSTYAPKSGE